MVGLGRRSGTMAVTRPVRERAVVPSAHDQRPSAIRGGTAVAPQSTDTAGDRPAGDAGHPGVGRRVRRHRRGDRRHRRSRRRTLLGPGDDGAVVAAPDGRVVASIDVLVDGVHFRTDWATGEQIGQRAALAAMADVAAMGAAPDRAAGRAVARRRAPRSSWSPRSAAG